MPSINKTLIIDTNIDYIGYLNPTGGTPGISGMSLEDYKYLIKDFTVITVLTMSMAATIIFGLLLKPIYNCIPVCFVGKEIYHARQENII